MTPLVTAVALLLLVASFASEAQPGAKIPRLGVLSGAAVPPSQSPRALAFLDGLREFGYLEGQTIAVEWRASGGRAERLPDLATELVRLSVDVIVAVDNPAIVAARRATRTIPIVMVLATDPVGTGFVASLARPGGNITGLTVMSTDIQGKALQLLKEAVPHASRVAVLWDPTEPARRTLAKEAEAVAAGAGLQVQLVGPRSPAELDNVFTTMARDRVGAAKSRLPTVG